MLYPRRFSFLLLAHVAMVTSAQAATSDEQFAARGIGAVECQALPGLLGDGTDPKMRDQLVAWIAGYISHANRSTDGTFDVMPVQDNYGVEALAELICAQNPTLLVESVMFEIVRAFSGNTITGVSDLVTIQQDDKKVELRAETLKRVQERLVALGHMSEEAADGQYGPMTRDALLAYQKSASLAESGLPDPLTLFLLLK